MGRLDKAFQHIAIGADQTPEAIPQSCDGAKPALSDVIGHAFALQDNLVSAALDGRLEDCLSKAVREDAESAVILSTTSQLADQEAEMQRTLLEAFAAKVAENKLGIALSQAKEKADQVLLESTRVALLETIQSPALDELIQDLHKSTVPEMAKLIPTLVSGNTAPDASLAIKTTQEQPLANVASTEAIPNSVSGNTAPDVSLATATTQEQPLANVAKTEDQELSELKVCLRSAIITSVQDYGVDALFPEPSIRVTDNRQPTNATEPEPPLPPRKRPSPDSNCSQSTSVVLAQVQQIRVETDELRSRTSNLETEVDRIRKEGASLREALRSKGHEQRRAHPS